MTGPVTRTLARRCRAGRAWPCALGAAAVCLAAFGCAEEAGRWRPLSSESDAATETARVRWSTIGASALGRPIEAVTWGRGPRRVYIIGGIHGDEPEGLAVAGSLGATARPGTSATVRIVRDMNPDGTIARTRTNSRGVDLNRNWPASNFRAGGGRGRTPLSEAETQVVHRDLLRFDPDLVIVLHSARAGPFVNFDGPAAGAAERFVGAARVRDPRWRVVPRMGYATPGSIGSFVGVDGRIPILTVEFARGEPGEPGRGGALAGLGALLGAEAVASAR